MVVHNEYIGGIGQRIFLRASRQAVFSLVRMRICLNPNPYFSAVTTATDTPAHFVTLPVLPTLYLRAAPFYSDEMAGGCFRAPNFQSLNFSDLWGNTWGAKQNRGIQQLSLSL